MNSVRKFVRRLSDIVERGNTETPLSRLHRRVLVPEEGRFILEGTIVRSLPFEPTVPFNRPGVPREVPQVLEWFDQPDDGDRSAFTDNDLGVDLAAILALATGRRVAFANEIPFSLQGAAWTEFLEVGHSLDSELYGPAGPELRNRFVTAVKAIVALPEDKALALGGAIRMRNAACCLVESDHSSAYGLLVVSLETLSRAFGNPPTSWADWNDAGEWDAFFLSTGITGQQAERLRERLLSNKQIRLRRTFIEYAASNLAASFWEGPYYCYTPNFEVNVSGVQRGAGTWQENTSIAMLVPQNASELRRRLGKSYDARSEVFHQSARLDQIVLVPIPGNDRQPLPFAGLRRIIDHLLWIEIGEGARDAPDLPDFQVVASNSI